MDEQELRIDPTWEPSANLKGCGLLYLDDSGKRHIYDAETMEELCVMPPTPAWLEARGLPKELAAHDQNVSYDRVPKILFASIKTPPSVIDRIRSSQSVAIS